jgi:hypothetical protein
MTKTLAQILLKLREPLADWLFQFRNQFRTPTNLKFILSISAALSLALMAVSSGLAQSGISLQSHSAKYLFGEWMRFEAQFESQSQLVDGHIVLQIEGLEELYSFTAEIDSNNYFRTELFIPIDLDPPSLRLINFWYLVATEDGSIFESDLQSIYYDDNRFDWFQLTENNFSVYWFAGDQIFAEAILNTANEAVQRVQQVIPLPGPNRVDLYIYPSQDQLLDVVNSSNIEWAAGHSDLSQDRIFLSINPNAESSLEIERQVPHEIAHIMLYEALGENAYLQLPAWLVEGIASNAEMYSDPLNAELLRLAFADQSLPSLFALCESFPSEYSSARNSYAAADSFMAYLRTEYQVIGIGAIVDAYARNDDCMFGLEPLLGKNLLELELDWHAREFGEANTRLGSVDQATSQILILIMLGLILLVWRQRVNAN